MKIKFIPQNIEVEVTSEKSVLQIAQENNIHIKSVCKGVPSCAECRVNIVEGDHNVLPPSPTELGLIGSAYFVDHRRLSCQLHCFGDITVDLKEQLEKADRAIGTKRPRGAKAEYDPKNSSAVMGNIIHEEEQNKADAQERKANRRIFEEEKQRLLKMLREQRAEKDRLKKEAPAAPALAPVAKPDQGES